MNYIIDSYAWIEYFIGSKKGKILKKLFLDQENKFFTVECCLAEIKGWTLRNNIDFLNLLKTIKSNSTITSLGEIDWIKAGEERFNQREKQKDFGLIDSIIIVKQNELNSQVISGDKHFKSLKNVVFLE